MNPLLRGQESQVPVRHPWWRQGWNRNHGRPWKF